MKFWKIDGDFTTTLPDWVNEAIIDNLIHRSGDFFTITRADGSCVTCNVSDGYYLINDANGLDIVAPNNLLFKDGTPVGYTLDFVNHPPHYETGKFESIEVMEEVFGREYVKGFCLCNAFKYLYRCKKKHETPVEDIKKAIWYLNKYLEYCYTVSKFGDSITIRESDLSDV